ncbi:MAG: rod shape-determining protein MreC [Synergistaceae bacterium]|nr:rod shape-determining protein MreC [Synergistaceae bacterium]
MDNFRSTAREWAHGLTALILGLFLLGISSGLGIVKNIVDFWGALLSIPEYPAVIMREIYISWRTRSRDKNFLNDEITRLREENAKLRLDLAKLSSSQNFLPVSNDIRIARVTLRAPMSWWNEIRIDRGEHDKITQGLPVFYNGYLIGRVSSVSLMSSWVELITSPSFLIPAVIEETRELGVVAGDGNGGVVLRYIPAAKGAARAGMKISTAMIGEQFPSGLPIGTITNEFTVGPDGYATYRIDTGADLSRFFTVSY